MDTDNAIHESNRAQHLIRFLKKLPISNYLNKSLEKTLEDYLQSENSKKRKSCEEYKSYDKSNKLDNFHKVLYIELKKIHTPRKFALIPLSIENRKYFPGYKQDFYLDTETGRLIVHVTSGNDGDILGDREAGNYIVGKLQDWFRFHKKLKDGSILRIDIIEREKLYRLSVQSY
ncbi:MAG: hypothetical protein IPM32_09340 [Ignavibacteriae bacterium]|nr:hypothetical protein [Ignavibacteriota bacterium]